MQKVLVVEDDLALSAGLCFELDASGYLTVASYSCKKAEQLLKTEHFDLAILDVNLPDGNGFHLCREIKRDIPDLPVIFLTANDLEQDELEGFDLARMIMLPNHLTSRFLSGEWRSHCGGVIRTQKQSPIAMTTGIFGWTLAL